MALQNREQDGNVFKAQTTRAQVYETADVTAGKASRIEIFITESGKNVNVPNDPYARTNFFVDQSRQYVPNVRLRKYVSFGRMNTFFCIFLAFHLGMLLFLLCGIQFFGIPVAVITLIIDIIPLVVYSQHVSVNKNTIPWLLKFPVEKQDTLNKHFEVEIAAMETIFVEAKKAGLGAFVTVGGKAKMKIMVLDKVGLTSIKIASDRGRLFFCIFASIMAILWSFGWLIVHIVHTSYGCFFNP